MGKSIKKSFRCKYHHLLSYVTSIMWDKQQQCNDCCATSYLISTVCWRDCLHAGTDHRRQKTKQTKKTNTTKDTKGLRTVPRTGLHPVDGVEEGGRAAVAGVGGVDALHVRVAGVLEQLHEDRLDRLGLVDDGLRADLQPADAVVGQAVALHQPLDHRQAQRVDVLAVRAEAHARLAQADGVFAGRHAVKLLQLGLVHVLRREVELHGNDAHVFRPRAHAAD